MNQSEVDRLLEVWADEQALSDSERDEIAHDLRRARGGEAFSGPHAQPWLEFWQHVGALVYVSQHCGSWSVNRLLKISA
jgi:hypothetical protein